MASSRRCRVLLPGVLAAALAAGPAFDPPRAGERDDLTPLLEAARGHEYDRAMQLVLDGADVTVTENDGTTALHWAAYAGAESLVVALLDAGADPNAANRYGMTPLHAAAEGGFAVAVQALLDAGADPNVVLPEGETILMAAARSGNVIVLQALLDAGVGTEARDDFYGETALIHAVLEDHPDAVRVLVMHGADVDATSARMDYASRRAGQSVLGLGEWTPLFYAARENALDAGRVLLAAGADTDRQDPDGATALVIAIINAHYEFAAMLIDAGADPNLADNDAAMGPLYAVVDMHRLAVGHGRGNPQPVGLLGAVDVARLLLEHGADPNAALDKPILTRTHTIGDQVLGAGTTPLLRAAKSGDIEMVRLLVEHGADPFATLPNGTTALHLAAGLGWRYGTPLAPSYDQGPDEEAVAAIDYLVGRGLDVNARNDSGDTPLHAAAASGRSSVAIVAALLAHGAATNSENGSGETALAIAERREQAALVGRLNAAGD